MMRWSFGRGDIEGLHHHAGAGGIVGLVLMIILWAALIAALVFAIRALILYSRHRPQLAVTGTSGDFNPPAGSAPTPTTPQFGPAPDNSSLLATLQERYARGEIDRDEFLQRKQDLGLG